jgi:hypothetical protein
LSKQKEFIYNYFSNVYKKPDDQRADYTGCIEEFLGPEILENKIVVDSKLKADEADLFEGQLSLDELDASVKEAKKSACGSDGISNCFIKKFWRIFRMALFRYSSYCCDNRALTQTLNGATIRLIPKKGDCSKIKNWRPISLLSCMYKVLSRAAINRLKKIRDLFFSRA